MDYKHSEHFVGEKALFDKSRNRPKMNYHHSERNGRLVWCGCMKNMRIGGKIYWCRNFWYVRKDGSGRTKYRIRPIWK